MDAETFPYMWLREHFRWNLQSRREGEISVAGERTGGYSTRMIPFRVELRPGSALHEQVTYAVRKAIVSGQLRAGAAFPSVRALSRELKINPNTAHKVVGQLVADGLLASKPGIGTVVCAVPEATKAARTELLSEPLEHLVVEAKRLGLGLDELSEAVERHWKRLKAGKDGKR
jgi:GntR family transcriptional regulator